MFSELTGIQTVLNRRQVTDSNAGDSLPTATSSGTAKDEKNNNTISIS